MSLDHDPPLFLSDESLVVYLTALARTFRRLERAHGQGSSRNFLDVVEQALAVEIHQFQLDEGTQVQVFAIHGALLRLVETMPPDEDL